LGRPLIQHPEDIVRLQEVIYILKPDVIIETIAHGGSLVSYATLLKGMGKRGRVIGIDVEIQVSNREAIEKHKYLITLLQLKVTRWRWISFQKPRDDWAKFWVPITATPTS
jgi:cephalosporin hydroxylase